MMMLFHLQGAEDKQRSQLQRRQIEKIKAPGTPHREDQGHEQQKSSAWPSPPCFTQAPAFCSFVRLCGERFLCLTRGAFRFVFGQLVMDNSGWTFRAQYWAPSPANWEDQIGDQLRTPNPTCFFAGNVNPSKLKRKGFANFLARTRSLILG